MKVVLSHPILLVIILFAPPVLDAQEPAKAYKVDAVTPDCFIVRHAGGIEWVAAPLNDSARREKILSGNDPDVLTRIPAEKKQVPPPRSGGSGASSFVYDGYRAPSPGRSGVVLSSIRSSYVQERNEQIIRTLPGGYSPRELPWEFVANEAAMLVHWFVNADENDPEDAVISDYIRQQHRPDVLIYRLLIRPWLKKEPPEGS